MATEVIVTSAEFAGIRNPYTGVPMKVMMLVGCGPDPLFHSEDTYSTADLCPSTKDLYRLWGRVDGREGLRTGCPKCAYTGEPLAVQQVDGRYRLVGGFDPRVLRTRDEFLYYATMRDGKATRSKPDPVTRVTKPPVDAKPSESQKRHAESVTPDVSQESIDIAAKTISDHKDELPLPTKMGYTGKGKRR